MPKKTDANKDRKAAQDERKMLSRDRGPKNKNLKQNERGKWKEMEIMSGNDEMTVVCWKTMS